MAKGPFITGWCNGPNHYLCKRFYTGRNGNEYMCECPCHQRKVKKVRRPGSIRKEAIDVG